MRQIEKVVEEFRKSGLKITPQRLSLFSLIRENRNHPSAEDIYLEALSLHPSISFTTVYKTLQTLRDLGEIVELSIDPARVHYDPVVEDHFHTFCTSCRRIQDMKNTDFIRVERTEGNRCSGFEVRHVQVHLVGVCEQCLPDGSEAFGPA